MSRLALAVYHSAGAALAERYESVSADAVFAPFLNDLPAPTTALDVGGGSGRDAAWLQERGFAVTVAEPAEPLRSAGMARYPALEWVADDLPGLATLGPRRFGLILVNAVWHHLDPTERDIAMARLAALLAPGGRLLLSLRQGPPLPGQPVAETLSALETARARAAGLHCLNDIAAPPRSDAPGIGWQWLILERSIT